jgi:hypothetical protein
MTFDLADHCVVDPFQGSLVRYLSAAVGRRAPVKWDACNCTSNHPDQQLLLKNCAQTDNSSTYSKHSGSFVLPGTSCSLAASGLNVGCWQKERKAPAILFRKPSKVFGDRPLPV